MIMKIKEVFNSTKEEIENKMFNIFIAFCLGNKFFLKGNLINEENIKDYLKLALKDTKEKVILLIADKIQATNYNVRNNNTKSYNYRRVFRDGKKIKEQLENFVDKYFSDKKERIKIIQWEEYENQDLFCKETTRIIYKKFNEDKIFREEVFKRVKETMTDRYFTDKQYWEMCNYILDEFSVVYSGLVFEKMYYGLFFYPKMDSIAYFIEDVKKGKLFPELTKKLPKEKVALAIVN